MVYLQVILHSTTWSLIMFSLITLRGGHNGILDFIGKVVRFTTL